MSRCVSILTLTLLFYIFLGIGTRVQAQGLKFDKVLLTVDANEGIDIADVNNDGKLDIIAGRNWYQAPEFVPKPLRSIKDWNGYVESNGDFAFDVNRDGKVDLIAGSFLPTKVFWFENPGPEKLKLGAMWQRHELVDTKQSSNEASVLRDLDGDGVPEWITNSWDANNPLVAWSFEYPTSDDGSAKSKPAQPKMKRHILGVDGNSHGMGFGDINNDGLEDILIGTGWYERPTGNIWEKPWKFHADWKFLHSSIPMYVRDLDGDGLNDVIWGRGHEYGLFWWKSTGIAEDGSFQYKEVIIDKDYSQPHTMHFADLDADGADELITGKRVRAHNGGDPGGTEMPCMYYYHWDKSKSEFIRHTIDEGRVGTGLQIRTADLNGDQKLDIAVAGKDGTWILFNKGQSSNSK